MPDEKCPSCNSEEIVHTFAIDHPDRGICRDCFHEWILVQQSLPGMDWSRV
jgi:hypothetical protein